MVKGDPLLAQIGQIGAPLIVRKSADETVNNSTTLQNDDALLLAIAANEVWLAEFFILYDSSAAADIKFALTVPAGATVTEFLGYARNAAGTLAVLSATTPTMGGAGAGSTVMGKIWAIVANGANAGNIQLQWAQDVAEVSNTKVLTNSCLIAHKLA